MKRAGTIYEVKLTDITPPSHDVRISIHPDRIRELADSIKEIGQQTPIVLRKSTPPYEISQGHRRFLACKLLNKETILATFTEADDATNFIARATENLQREDLSPIEEAKIYQTLRQTYGLTIREIATKFGKSESHITQTQRLLEAPEFVQAALHKRTISPASVLCLLQIEDPAVLHPYLQFAVENGITLAVAKSWVNQYKRTRNPDEHAPAEETVIRHIRTRTVYHECGACKQPTDIETMKSLFLCTDCYNYLLNDTPHPALQEAGTPNE